MKLAFGMLALLAPVAAHAQAFGSAEYCGQLAEVGSNAYQTKRDGYSLQQVLKVVGAGLADNPKKQQAAQGVVTLIYGDSSIKSAAQAYKIVYDACKR
jgi:hypothetical protein